MMLASKWWRRCRPLVLLASIVLLHWLARRNLDRVAAPPSCDFLQYWAAARLNILGKNPFEGERVLALWQAAEWDKPWALVMYNPPWVLTLMAPWASVDVDTSWLLWQVFLCGCVVVSADRLWYHYGGPANLRWLSWAVGIVFVPSIIAVRSGQLGPVVLLGLVLFVVGVDPRQGRGAKEWLAAVGLLLISTKPHVVYLLWVALALWCAVGRRWSLLGRAGVLTAAALLFAVCENPLVLAQYATAVMRHPPDQWLSATWGSYLRMALGWEHFWLQFLPSILASTCYVAYVWRRVRRWDWGRELPILVLCALVTRPYGWTHDLVVSLVPLVAVTACAAAGGQDILRRVIPAYAILEVVMVLGNNLVPLGDHQLVWLPLSVASCYVLMVALIRRKQTA